MTDATFPFWAHDPPSPARVVVEVPHAGLLIDERSRRATRASDAAVRADADLGADVLFAAALEEGACLVVATASRYVVDLNAAPALPTAAEEKLPDALRPARFRSASGERWSEPPLARAELERRHREVLEPYHEAVASRLAAARARHGRAILVSGHTYPEALFPRAADLVIGTLRGRSASPALAERIAEVARAHGLSVALDDPFAGAYALERHARPAERVEAVQLELARRLATSSSGVADAGRLAPAVRAITRALRDFD